MRRIVLLLALLAPLVCVPAAAAQSPPPLRAALMACATGEQPADRLATFTASMPAIPGTRRMAMRFDLLQRREAGAPFAAIAVPNWGRWERSQPGRPGLIYTKRVEGLLAPGAYRAVVQFRWYGAGGRVLRRARRTTTACAQPDLRPDLRAGALEAGPAAAAQRARYRLVVRNDGRGDAGRFAVVLTIDGAAQPPVAVAGLVAGARTEVTVAAPRCRAGGTVGVAVDAGFDVVESAEADNVVARPCPPAAQAG